VHRKIQPGTNKDRAIFSIIDNSCLKCVPMSLFVCLSRETEDRVYQYLHFFREDFLQYSKVHVVWIIDPSDTGRTAIGGNRPRVCFHQSHNSPRILVQILIFLYVIIQVVYGSGKFLDSGVQLIIHNDGIKMIECSVLHLGLGIGKSGLQTFS